MALYDELVNMVAIHVSPCPEVAIYDATRHVVREFCRESRVWVHECEALSHVDVGAKVELTIPEDSVIIYIWGINGRCGVYGDDSLNYFVMPPNFLMLNHPQRNEVKPLVSLMPSIESTEYPDFIKEYFCEGLVSGVVSYLQMQPDRAWSQPNMAVPHQLQYEHVLNQAKQMRDNGLNISPVNRRIRPTYM